MVVTQFLSDLIIISWTCILGRLWNPLLSRLFSNFISLFLLFIFNSTSIDIVLGKMTKLCTNETSFRGISFLHMMFYTIHSNVSKFSTVMTFTPGVAVPTKYNYHNLLCWIQYLDFAFWWLVSMFLTFSFKSWFLFAFISLMTLLITIVALSIEFFFLHCSNICLMYDLSYHSDCK